MKFKQRFYGLWLILIGCYTATAQPTLPPVYNHAPKDYVGLAQNFDMVEDPRGVKYFANGDGVLEFDGRGWRKIRTTGERYVLSLDIDSSGTVFVGAWGEFGLLRPDSTGSLGFVSLSDQLPDSLQDFNAVWKTHAIGDKVFFNAFDYLFLYEHDTFRVIRPHSVFSKSAVLNKRLVIHDHDLGFLRFEKDSLLMMDGGDFFAHKNTIAKIPFHPDGSSAADRLLVSIQDGDLVVFDPGATAGEEIIPFEPECCPRIAEVKVYGGTQLRNGHLVLASLTSGMWVFSPEGALIRHTSREQGLLNEKVTNAKEDGSGNIWLTLDNGIGMVAHRDPVEIAREGKNFTGAVLDMIRVGGYQYMATNNSVYRFRDEMSREGTSVMEKVAGIDNQSFKLRSTGHGILVVSNEGVFRIDGLQANKIDGFVGCTFAEPGTDQDLIIAGGLGGLIVLEARSGQWVRKKLVSDLPDEILNIQEADTAIFGAAKHYWLGLRSENLLLVSFRNDYNDYHITAFDSSHGLPAGEVRPFRLNGRVVFGTDVGLYRYNPSDGKIAGTFEPDPTLGDVFADGSMDVFRLTTAPDGMVWLNAGEGNGINLCIPQKDGSYQRLVRPFAAIDIGQVNTFFPDVGPEGRNHHITWIGGDDGLARFDHQKNKDIDRPYSTLIRTVKAGQDSLLFGGSFGYPAGFSSEQTSFPVLTYHQNDIKFEFAAAYYEKPEQLAFSYQLVGYDKNWSKWGPERNAIYTNLSAGEYRFLARSRNVYGTESISQPYVFSVLPPWYLTIWAIIGYVILAGGAFYGGIKLNAKRLEREKQALEVIVRQRTREVVEQKEVIEEKNKSITASINYARRIQEAILPSDEEMDRHLPEHFILNMPRDIVSGDFYWLKTTQDGKIVVAAADCTGHGVPGAFMSMIGAATLRQSVVEKGKNTAADILDDLNKEIQAVLQQNEDHPASDNSGGSDEQTARYHLASDSSVKDGMDIALCILDKTQQSLNFAGAYNPLYFFRDGALQIVKGDRFPVAGFSLKKNRSFSNHHFDLQPGDTFYIFSDGFADQFGGHDNKKFTYKRFQQILTDNQERSMKQQQEILHQAIEDWKKGHKQIDDILVIGIRY